MKNMKYSVIILGAGLGSRFNSTTNKVWHSLNGQPILNWSIQIFYMDPSCAQVIVVISQKDYEHAARLHKEFPSIHTVFGGHCREESVSNAVGHVTSEYCFIHDGARPYVSLNLVAKLADALLTSEAVIPAYVTESSKHPDREIIFNGQSYRVQTPQGFATPVLKNAFLQCRRANCFNEFRDDASLVEHYTGVIATVVPGDPKNIKITYPDDLKTSATR